MRIKLAKKPKRIAFQLSLGFRAAVETGPPPACATAAAPARARLDFSQLGQRRRLPVECSDSAAGNFFWEERKAKFMQESIWTSPSPKIKQTQESTLLKTHGCTPLPPDKM